ncbi:MAG: Rieske (2Fe-2S) protein [Planctomycetes bacterium]|nr:Rieske (2Fe-2S) protein [Planctomycetota bacterium]
MIPPSGSSPAKKGRFEKPVKRRNFLGFAAVGSFLASWGAGIIGALRLPIPSVYPEANPRFRIGRPDRFPVGSVTRIPGRNVWIFRDERGFYAISAVCTHLGCIVDRGEDHFKCPCHGSVFDEGGKVLSGPAPSPLPWLEIGLDPSGELIVDTQVAVPPGSRYAV